jgi:hypothetical protein
MISKNRQKMLLFYLEASYGFYDEILNHVPMLTNQPNTVMVESIPDPEPVQDPEPDRSQDIYF